MFRLVLAVEHAARLRYIFLSENSRSHCNPLNFSVEEFHNFIGRFFFSLEFFDGVWSNIVSTSFEEFHRLQECPHIIKELQEKEDVEMEDIIFRIINGRVKSEKDETDN